MGRPPTQSPDKEERNEACRSFSTSSIQTMTDSSEHFISFGPSTARSAITGRRAVRLSIFGFLVMVFLVGTTACDGSGGNDDDDPTDPTVQEDVASIENALDVLAASGSTLESGSFSSALKSFLDLQDGDILADAFVESVVSDDLIDLMTLRQNARGDDAGFDFAASAGIYEWNPNLEQWERGSDADAVVVRGPASAEAPSNNAVLTISSYADEAVTIDGAGAFLPTAVEASLTVDDQEEFSLSLVNTVYDTDGDTPIPVEFDLTIFTRPFTHALSVRQNTSTEFVVDFSITDADGETVGGLQGTLLLASDDYETLDDEDFQRATLTVDLGSGLTVVAEADVGDLLVLDDPTAAEVNAEITATVQLMGRTVGTLQYDDETDDFVVVYRDDTSDPADRFYDPLLDDLEEIFEDYLGDLDLDDF
jgi:hypothetical protein